MAKNRFSLYESMSASLYDSFMSHNVGGHGAKPGDFVRVNCTGIVFYLLKTKSMQNVCNAEKSNRISHFF